MKEIYSFPKVNICFKILGFLPNNYCKIASRFLKVKHKNLRDTLNITESSDFNISGNFDCQMQENTIFKAKEALKFYLQNAINTAPHNHINSYKNAINLLDCFHIEVEKKIPAFAGLGGGSSNAASFLLAMNEILELKLSKNILCKIAKNIGADVSFFVCDYDSANVFGIGEKVESFSETIPDLEIITPNIKCSTKAVYDEFRKKQQLGEIDFFHDESELLKQDSTNLLQKNTRNFLNDLYLAALAIYPQLSELAKDGYFFSGSGSSFFRLKSVK